MKPLFNTLNYLIVLALLFSFSFVFSNTIDKEDFVHKLISLEDVVGAWNYTVENAPYEYSKGILMITKKDEAYNVDVQLTAGTLPAEDVEVDGGKITFVVYVEGSKVSVVLNVDGDKITGESSSMDGVFAIKGARIQPQ